MLALGKQGENLEVALEGIKHHVSNAIHDLAAGAQYPQACSKVREAAEGPVTSDQETKELEGSSHDGYLASTKLSMNESH